MPDLTLKLQLIGTHVLLIALCVPLVQGRIPRNPWYGFRTSKTMRDDTTWRMSNAYMGRVLIGACLIGAIMTLLTLPFALPNALLLALWGAPLGLALVASFRYTSRL